VDGYCVESNKDYEYLGCQWHGHTNQSISDNTNTNGDTLAARYEQTTSRLEQITHDGYEIKVQWECEFHVACIETNELLAHSAVCHNPLCKQDALYACRTESMRLYYKAPVCENIHCVDLMSLYTYICNYFKFPAGHPVIRVENAYKVKQDCLLLDGLIKYFIVPTERLCNPSLPFRANQKLMFCLCRTSVLNLQYRRMQSYDRRGESTDWYVGH